MYHVLTLVFYLLYRIVMLNVRQTPVVRHGSTERNSRSDQVRVLPRSLRPVTVALGLHFATETETRLLQYNHHLSDPFLP
jgi:hypothetical protein